MREFSVFRNAEHYYDPTAGGAITNIEEGEKIMEKFAKGGIWYCNTGRMNKAPVLIVSDMEQMKDGYVIVSAITSKSPTAEPDPAACEILTRYLSVAHLNNLRTVPMGDLEEFMRSCTDAEMAQIDKCLRFVLDLPDDTSDESAAALDAEKDVQIAQMEKERLALIDEKRMLAIDLKVMKEQLESMEAKYREEFSKNRDISDCYTKLLQVEAERDIYKQQYEMLLEKLLHR